MSDPDKFFTTSPSKTKPRKKSLRDDKESKEPDSFSTLYPIYWIRILEVLKERKDLENDYKSNPTKFNTREGNFDDLKFEGLTKTPLTEHLSVKITSSNLQGENFDPVLKMMTDPISQYINAYEDKKKMERFRITLLGELALKQMNNEDILSGYWNLVRKTNLPKKTKVTSGKY